MPEPTLANIFAAEAVIEFIRAMGKHCTKSLSDIAQTLSNQK